jgi:hypothetical protein
VSATVTATFCGHCGQPQGEADQRICERRLLMDWLSGFDERTSVR